MTVIACAVEDQVQEFFLPLGLAWGEANDDPAGALAGATLARVRQRARVGVLYDAFAADDFCRAVLQAIGTAWAAGSPNSTWPSPRPGTRPPSPRNRSRPSR